MHSMEIAQLSFKAHKYNYMQRGVSRGYIPIHNLTNKKLALINYQHLFLLATNSIKKQNKRLLYTTRKNFCKR